MAVSTPPFCHVGDATGPKFGYPNIVVVCGLFEEDLTREEIRY